MGSYANSRPTVMPVPADVYQNSSKHGREHHRSAMPIPFHYPTIRVLRLVARFSAQGGRSEPVLY